MKHRYLKVFAVAVSLMGGVGGEAVFAGNLDDLRGEVSRLHQAVGSQTQEVDCRAQELANLQQRYREAREAALSNLQSQVRDQVEAQQRLLASRTLRARGALQGLEGTETLLGATNISEVTHGGIFPYIRMADGSVNFLVVATKDQHRVSWDFPQTFVSFLPSTTPTLEACLSTIGNGASRKMARVTKFMSEQLLDMPHVFDEGFLGFFADVTDQFPTPALFETAFIENKQIDERLKDELDKVMMVSGDALAGSPQQFRGSVCCNPYITSSIRISDREGKALATDNEVKGGSLFCSGGARSIIRALKEPSSFAEVIQDRSVGLPESLERAHLALREAQKTKNELEAQLQATEKEAQEEAARVGMTPQGFMEKYANGYSAAWLKEETTPGTLYPSLKLKTMAYLCPGLSIQIPGEGAPRTIVTCELQARVRGGDTYLVGLSDPVLGDPSVQLQQSSRLLFSASANPDLVRLSGVQDDQRDNTVVPFTDPNWDHGIARVLVGGNTALLFRNTASNRDQFLPGNTLTFSLEECGQRAASVVNLIDAGPFLHVHAQGSLIDALRAGPWTVVSQRHEPEFQVSAHVQGAPRWSFEAQAEYPSLDTMSHTQQRMFVAEAGEFDEDEEFNDEPSTSGSGHQISLIDVQDVKALEVGGTQEGMLRVKLPVEAWENAQSGCALYSSIWGKPYVIVEREHMEPDGFYVTCEGPVPENLENPRTIQIGKLPSDFVSSQPAGWNRGWRWGIFPTVFFVPATHGNEHFFSGPRTLRFTGSNGEVLHTCTTKQGRSAGPFLHIDMEPAFTGVGELRALPTFTVVEPLRTVQVTSKDAVVQNNWFTHDSSVLLLKEADFALVGCQAGGRVDFLGESGLLGEATIESVLPIDALQALLVTLDREVSDLRALTTYLTVTEPASHSEEQFHQQQRQEESSFGGHAQHAEAMMPWSSSEQ